MTHRTLLLAAGLLALTACGSRPELPEDVVITESNALSLLAAVWADNVETEATDALLEAGPLLNRYLPLVALQPNGATIDVPCEGAGSVSVVGQVADANRPGRTVGDKLTTTWSACSDRTGPYAEVSSGRIVLEMVAVAVNSQTFTLAYDGFATTMSTFGTFTTNGTLTITFATNGAVATVTADAAQLTGSGGGLQEKVEDKHLHLVDSGDAYDAAFSLEFSAKATSSRWGNRRLAYETPVAFTGTSDTFPSQGQLLLRGANGATARMTAVDATGVRVELDLDGDGAVDPGGTSTTTWVAIDDAEFGGSQ
jgi:hypothetical protein